MARYRQLPIHDARDRAMDAHARILDVESHLHHGRLHKVLESIETLKAHWRDTIRLIDQQARAATT